MDIIEHQPQDIVKDSVQPRYSHKTPRAGGGNGDHRVFSGLYQQNCSGSGSSGSSGCCSGHRERGLSGSGLTTSRGRGHSIGSSLRRDSSVATRCRGFFFGTSTIVRDRAAGPWQHPLDLVERPGESPRRSLPVTSTIVRVVFPIPVGCGFVPNDTFFIFLCFLLLTVLQ